MKLFTKKIKNVPTFHYELADGTTGIGKGQDELAYLMTEHLTNRQENSFKWRWDDGEEWFTMTPETYDIYWVEGM